MKLDIKVTSLHSLKLGNEFDFSDSIVDTTHEQIVFTKYVDDGPVRSWECVISDEVFFDCLKPHLKEVDV